MSEDDLKQIKDLALMRYRIMNTLQLECKMFGIVGWATYNTVGMCNTCNPKVMDACVKISVNHMHLCHEIKECSKCRDYNQGIFSFCEEIRRVRDDESACIPCIEKLSAIRLNKTKRRQMFSFKEEKSEISEKKVEQKIEKFSEELNNIVFSNLPTINHSATQEMPTEEEAVPEVDAVGHDVTYKQRIADDMDDLDLPADYYITTRSYLDGIGENFGYNDDVSQTLATGFDHISQFDRRIYGIFTQIDVEHHEFPLLEAVDDLLEALHGRTHLAFSSYYHDSWTRLHDTLFRAQFCPFRWRIAYGTPEEVRGMLLNMHDDVTMALAECTDECMMHVVSHFLIALIVNDYKLQEPAQPADSNWHSDDDIPF